jgi:tRNA nucleotidyltransferase (CCA-adding enzyme)
MAYTLAILFDKFREHIELSGDHRETATAPKDRVISLLKNDFEILDAFATGSIRRFTAVRGHADLDVMVVLHYGKHIKDKKPSAVLQEVRDSLGEYKTNVRKNGQAVTLHYETWPNVDIVPVSRSVNDQGSTLTMMGIASTVHCTSHFISR